jgi:2-polyprenyl-3-methyl-5-hydroxy-6-metoxy-1,4-benzoquinol methylase
MAYNPVKYWTDRKILQRTEPPLWGMQYISDHLVGESVLDFGTGDGAKLKLFAGRRVTGVDIVDTNREIAIRIASKYGIDYEHWIGGLEDFSNRSFDTVVCSKVLLHIPPKDFPGTIAELKRVMNKRIIVWDTATPSKSDHCFNHPFNKYFTMQNIIIIDGHMAFYSE